VVFNMKIMGAIKVVILFIKFLRKWRPWTKIFLEMEINSNCLGKIKLVLLGNGSIFDFSFFIELFPAWLIIPRVYLGYHWIIPLYLLLMSEFWRFFTVFFCFIFSFSLFFFVLTSPLPPLPLPESNVPCVITSATIHP